MNKSAWLKGVAHEVAFWEGELQKQVQDGLNLRFPVVSDLQFLVDAGSIDWPPKQTVRCLDVGSGPFAHAQPPDIPAEFIYADALGHTYNRLLTKYNFVNMPRIRQIRGEDLVDAFGEETFDHVSCSNALDHCEDPKRTFDQMVSVCRPGGLITILSVENEGENQTYGGLHQWNLAIEDGKFVLWNHKGKIDILRNVPHELSFDWKYEVNDDDPDYKIFLIKAVRRR